MHIQTCNITDYSFSHILTLPPAEASRKGCWVNVTEGGGGGGGHVEDHGSVGVGFGV